MTSSQHYAYTDDSNVGPLHHRQHPHDGGKNNHSDDNHHRPDDTSDDIPHGNEHVCMEACQSLSSVNPHMCGGYQGVVWDSHRLTKYFTHGDGNDHSMAGDYDPHHHSSNSPYLYSPSAPVGPSRCEYCGGRNTEDCSSNLPAEYWSISCEPPKQHSNNGNIGGGEFSNTNSNGLSTPNKRNNTNGEEEEDGTAAVCHRPKLFFLKKKPPFATPDGWNPVTEYRSNLFEPPSSVEGMGRGWGEVRGRVGNHNAVNNASGGGGGGRADLNRSYASNGGCGSSVCGGGGGGGGVAETDISFSSATGMGGGGGGGDRASDSGSRAMSPAEWVTGLMGALSPS
mmetsp:Transcript_25850/g.54629  ORF Transcript_25850/g.54629 Transcript_25850/m.54629 type:complete len:339 (+) Transcript_25850:79-1095(+)|eukprot:CAMPEP_0183737084 /NCGR_PEP_ID=MMETSP0737-20130205/51025_1 /TAXON_ID=385413 /ORGANISM="Thalassiosira miniscula, Strain CCMP1093" /LENGTH=338 /DNA_ID=CAMNT_0025971279 /DNA_START=17 /DNA_END=1033 /DNA_ORIENTATION=-